MTKGIVQTLLKICQSCYHDHFHREPVSVTNHPLDEQPFPNTQPELPLGEFHSIAPYPITGHFRKESAPPLPMQPWRELQTVKKSLLRLPFSKLNKARDLSHSSLVLSSKKSLYPERREYSHVQQYNAEKFRILSLHGILAQHLYF